MRIYKTKWFQRFARRQGIDDASLREAVKRADYGQIDADLGSGVIKQRVARPGAGKSGGYRTLIFFKAAERSVFAFGFAKKDRDNVDASDEAELKRAARITLGLAQEAIDDLVEAGTLVEVLCDGRKDEDVPQ